MAYGDLPNYSSFARSESFNLYLQQLLKGPKTTEELVHHANALIAKLQDEENTEYNNLQCESGEIQYHKIMEAMLFHAIDGGGRRYTAAAICACYANGECESRSTLLRLGSLARTWLSHLLYVFRANSSHQGLTGSRIWTDEWHSIPADRLTPFLAQVLKREGYRCALTKRLDRQHPHRSPAEYSAWLHGCHILHPAIAELLCDKDPTLEAHLSAMTTLDILRNYASLPSDFSTCLPNLIDDPSNGLLLQYDVFCCLDEYEWAMEPTEIPDVYRVRDYGYRSPLRLPEIVRFEDHSMELTGLPATVALSLPLGVRTPNPLFIRIHAAIAGILHMSGAGEFLGEFIADHIDETNEDETNEHIHSGDEFDALLEQDNLAMQLDKLQLLVLEALIKSLMQYAYMTSTFLSPAVHMPVHAAPFTAKYGCE